MPSFTDIYPIGSNSGGGGDPSSAAAAPTTNDLYPGMPAGASPLHKTANLTAHGSVTIFTPPPGMKLVVASAFVSADAASRVAIVDGSDIPGRRIVEQYVGVNGGSSANLVPVPWPQEAPATAILLVADADAKVSARISGWLVEA